MITRFGTTARQRQLSDQLLPLRSHLPGAPAHGWLRTIREAYGISLETLGARIGITRQGARRIEMAEVTGALSIRKLREAADALECDVAIVLMPRARLEDALRNRAEAVATDDVERVSHSMTLEAQSLRDEVKAQLIHELAQELIDEKDPRIWRS